MNRRRKIGIGIGVTLVVITGGVIYLNSDENCGKVSKVKSDQRSMATAVESYFIDHGAYPATRPLRELCRFHPEELKKAGGYDLTCVEPGTDFIYGLTTPVAYLNPLFMEARPRPPKNWTDWWGISFVKYAIIGWEWRKAEFWPYAYYSDRNKGYIIWSSGPDGIYDITDPTQVYRPELDMGRPSPELVNLTYDPTNGAYSRGDVYRLKQ